MTPRINGKRWQILRAGEHLTNCHHRSYIVYGVAVVAELKIGLYPARDHMSTMLINTHHHILVNYHACAADLKHTIHLLIR